MNNEYMDNVYPKIDLIALIRGLIKSAMRLLVPGILLVVLATSVMCFRVWYSYYPRYQASASFTVHMKNPFYSTQQYYNNSAAEQMAKTFPQILTSGLLSDRVKEQLGITAMPDVRASAVGNTNIFTLTVTSPDPQVAYDVLNCVIENYPTVAEFVVGSTELALLDESGMPTQPVNRPDYIRSGLLGAFAGFAIWGCLAFFYWATHRTVSGEEELRSVINLPCIGRMPKVRGIKNGRCPVVNDRNDKFGFNESVRLLRIRVERALDKIGGKVLLVTSTLPNEGKTTVSINIATALAQKGKKVLLVDCDLRNPSVGSVLGIENQNGLSEFLKARCDINSIYCNSKIPNLSVVLGGKPVDNPVMLLNNRKAHIFVEEVKKSFDYVILDTPPSAMMADATEIGQWADASILTVRQDYALRRQILEAAQSLNDTGKPILGTIINMTTPQSGKSGYYGYGYGYYGSYGGRDDEE